MSARFDIDGTPTIETLQRWTSDEYACSTEAIPIDDRGGTYATIGADFQLDLLRAADARLPNGRRKHRLIVVEWMRGAGKTEVGAAIGLSRIVTSRSPITVGVGSVDADLARITQQSIAGFVRRSALLQQICEVQRDRVVNRQTGSVLDITSSDIPSSYGRRDFLCIGDEVALWEGDGLWNSAWSTIGKSRYAQMIVLQTPGWDKTTVGWKIRELARTTPEYYFSTLEGKPAPAWLADQIEEQRLTLPAEVFERLWMCRWVEGSGAFITREQLAKNIDPTWRAQLSGRTGRSYHAGLDLGLSADRTALSVLHYDRESQQIVLDALTVWSGSRDDPVLIADVEAAMAATSYAFRPVTFHLDPWQLKSTAQRLSNRLRIKEFTFTSKSAARLSANLLSLLRNGQMRLFPDAELEDELLRLEVRPTDYGFRIDHRSGGFSDRAMSIGMAALAAAERSKPTLTEIAMPDLRSNSIHRPQLAFGSEYSAPDSSQPTAPSKWR